MRHGGWHIDSQKNKNIRGVEDYTIIVFFSQVFVKTVGRLWVRPVQWSVLHFAGCVVLDAFTFFFPIRQPQLRPDECSTPISEAA